MCSVHNYWAVKLCCKRWRPTLFYTDGTWQILPIIICEYLVLFLPQVYYLFSVIQILYLISFTLYPLLRHSTSHFTSNSGRIACIVPELIGTRYPSTREVLILNIPRVGIETTTCHVYGHILCPYATTGHLKVGNWLENGERSVFTLGSFYFPCVRE